MDGSNCLDSQLVPGSCEAYQEAKREFSKSAADRISPQPALAARSHRGTCLIVLLGQGCTFRDEVFLPRNPLCHRLHFLLTLPR